MILDWVAHHFLNWALKDDDLGHSWLCPSCDFDEE